jgi:hypothetical protein
MHFHAKYVSTSVFGDGDYYQATFQAEQCVFRSNVITDSGGR